MYTGLGPGLSCPPFLPQQDAPWLKRRAGLARVGRGSVRLEGHLCLPHRSASSRSYGQTRPRFQRSRQSLPLSSNIPTGREQSQSPSQQASASFFSSDPTPTCQSVSSPVKWGCHWSPCHHTSRAIALESWGRALQAFLRTRML